MQVSALNEFWVTVPPGEAADVGAELPLLPVRKTDDRLAAIAAEPAFLVFRRKAVVSAETADRFFRNADCFRNDRITRPVGRHFRYLFFLCFRHL